VPGSRRACFSTSAAQRLHRPFPYLEVAAAAMKVLAEASTYAGQDQSEPAVTGAACAFRRHSQRRDYETFGFSRPGPLSYRTL
jgi:hypothetical protein